MVDTITRASRILTQADITEHITLCENECLKLVILQLGSSDYKADITVDLVGAGADVEIVCLYFPTHGEVVGNRCTINHIAPNCKSRVLYKGALKDKGTKASWIGNVVINKEATGTDTYEENRNLLLSRGARALSEPNLEILTGDIIGAGHASASSRFDDEQIFYLQSKGIAAKTAKQLLVEGYFLSVLETLDLPENEYDKFKVLINERMG